ncbi:hypothetical protein V6N12_007026 [Hibiscus sabdariffa]|uniref:Secreted protein n=1 Tax=Hibiscus sabdariffa TaxID=183260 RepID=A0ABR2F0L9_9ROSI
MVDRPTQLFWNHFVAASSSLFNCSRGVDSGFGSHHGCSVSRSPLSITSFFWRFEICRPLFAFLKASSPMSRSDMQRT